MFIFFISSWVTVQRYTFVPRYFLSWSCCISVYKRVICSSLTKRVSFRSRCPDHSPPLYLHWISERDAGSSLSLGTRLDYCRVSQPAMIQRRAQGVVYDGSQIDACFSANFELIQLQEKLKETEEAMEKLINRVGPNGERQVFRTQTMSHLENQFKNLLFFDFWATYFHFYIAVTLFVICMLFLT